MAMYVILRTESFAKLFFLLTSTGLLLYTILAFYTYHTAYVNVSHLRKYQSKIHGLSNPIPSIGFNNKIKYILMWTTLNRTSDNFGEGVFPFIDNKCRYTNCFLTSNKDLLNEDYKNFEAIIFNAKDMKDWRKIHLPLNRLEKQKYIFYSTLSSDDAPVCNVIADEYFNWTCTYRLDSDIFNPFIEVMDIEGNFIAPKDKVNWKRGMIELLDKHKMKILNNKTKAMAWIVNVCETPNNRMKHAVELQKLFRENSLHFDIYGCGFLDCPNGNCVKVLDDYYFYYAAEDSNALDYVTKEVLKAYHTFTVPIVKGGADYQKFLPEGSYINAGVVSMDKIVATVDYAIRNPTIYKSYHRWRKYYHIRGVNPFEGLCKVCEYLNDEEKFNRPSIKSNFRRWWQNRPLFERCFPRSAESLSYVLSYANESRKYDIIKM